MVKVPGVFQVGIHLQPTVNLNLVGQRLLVPTARRQLVFGGGDVTDLW